MATTWDPLHTDAAWTLSNSNRTITSTSGSSIYSVSNTRKTIAGGGKWYVELSFSGVGGTLAVAIADSTYSVPGPINTNQSFVVVNNNFASCWTASDTESVWSSGSHRCDFAIDLSSTPHRYYFRIDNGAWTNGGNPATQVGGVSPGAAESIDLRIATSSANVGTVVTLNTGASAFAGTVPTGFVGWDTSGGTPNGTWATTEAPDVFSARGYSGAFGVVGDLRAFENADTFAAVGLVASAGTLTVTENPDIFSAYGSQPITGHLTVTEAADRFNAAGIGIGVDGVMASTESVDIFRARGYTPNSGTWSSVENADQFRAVGVGVTVTKKRRVFFVT